MKNMCVGVSVVMAAVFWVLSATRADNGQIIVAVPSFENHTGEADLDFMIATASTDEQMRACVLHLCGTGHDMQKGKNVEGIY